MNRLNQLCLDDMKDWNQIIDKTWTLFLDRDGVVNERIIDGYVSNWDDFVFLPGVLEAMRYFSESFGHIILVTNQQGVGKGLMSHSDLELVHKKMVAEIKSAGGRIDEILCCTQLASDPTNFRKPKPDMAYQAKEIFCDIDFAKSIMVGDSQSDIDFGHNAGMHTVFIGDDNPSADDSVKSLFEFSKKLNL